MLMVQPETSPVPVNLRTLRCWNEGGVGIVLIDDNGKCSKYIYNSSYEISSGTEDCKSFFRIYLD